MAKVSLISFTPNALQKAALAAYRCYSDLDNVDLRNQTASKSDPDLGKFINDIIKTGHTSTIEHIYYTFLIEDVSRVLLAQLTRHRLASFSVQSQRYVRVDSEKPNWYIVPPSIASDPYAAVKYGVLMKKAAETYNVLCDRLVAIGRTEEQAQEDARFVLPEATATKLVVTMNARELLHFFSLRCCNRAQWEIRELANDMLELAKRATPELMENAGASCVSSGKCPEGKRGCGHPQGENNG